MKKNFLAISIVFTSILCLASCNSTEKNVSTISDFTADRLFDVETFNGASLDDTRLINPKDYVVLGPIIVKAVNEKGVTGYAEILEAAIEKYPETTAVINIVRDRKIQHEKLALTPKEYDYSWSGVAIKITDTFIDETTTTTSKTTSANGDITETKTYVKTYKKL